MTSPGSINAYGIEIRWQLTDLSTLLTTADINTTPATPKVTETSTGNSSGLNTGTKIGIGVGVTAAVFLALALILCLFWLRKRKRQQLKPVAVQNQNRGSWNPDNIRQSTGLPLIVHQSFTYGKAELSAEPVQAGHEIRQVELLELDGQNPR
jgi:hypothetical protein